MRIMRFIGFSASIMLLFGLDFGQAQSKPNLVQGKPYLIQLDCVRKLDRAAFHSVSQLCNAISYLKSLGRNADEYAKYLSKLSAPSWDNAKKLGIKYFVGGLYANGQLNTNYIFEVLEESDNLIKIRANRPYALYFKDNLTLSGVKIEEYERFRMIFHQEIAAYLGFEYSEKVEGGWSVITVTQKGEKK